MVSSSGSSSRCRRRVTLIKQPSREDACKRQRRFCHHGFIAPRWTAWAEGNPGRRFYGCRNYYQDGGCGYFAWHKCEFGERANVVIKELLDDIDKLYNENKQLRRENGGACLCEEVDSIHCELSKLKRMSERQNNEARKG